MKPPGPPEAGVAQDKALARVIGVPGAVMMGLGSILGTGIFVSVGIAAGIAGSSVLLAIAVAAVVAVFNGLSSAQLAASHPISGGTYEYGYRYLNPTLGFTAGWMFLSAKSASAATAALGFSGYALSVLGRTDVGIVPVALAVGAVALLTVIVAGGMTRSNRANTIIVSLTLGALFAFVVFGLPSAVNDSERRLPESFVETSSVSSFLHASALMFVAYTGYGRVATLGEEIREPRKNIPRAIVITLVCTMGVYAAVASVAVAAVGADALARATQQASAPLEVIARGFEVPAIAWVVALGAVTAMLGVLLNLLLGLSRVVFAMSRRGDLPRALAEVDARTSSPRAAVFVVGALIAVLAASGSAKTTWSFSAFTVLVYYALTNLAALKLPPAQRLYPVWVPCSGLVCCLGLAFWVDPEIWAAGLGLIALGLLWHRVAHWRNRHA